MHPSLPEGSINRWVRYSLSVFSFCRFISNRFLRARKNRFRSLISTLVSDVVLTGSRALHLRSRRHFLGKGSKVQAVGAHRVPSYPKFSPQYSSQRLITSNLSSISEKKGVFEYFIAKIHFSYLGVKPESSAALPNPFKQ